MNDRCVVPFWHLEDSFDLCEMAICEPVVLSREGLVSQPGDEMVATIKHKHHESKNVYTIVTDQFCYVLFS